jgi:hypothetical protein
MISADTYTVYRAALDRADAWIAAQGGSYWPEEAPPYVASVTNDIRGEVELYDLYTLRPARIMAYTSWDDHAGAISTWLGHPLGTYRCTQTWRDRHGRRRHMIDCQLPGIGRYRGQWCTVQQCVNLKRVGDC